ncbi:MAG TPA: hypothetical protein VLM40_23760 [Gemmata sp.]|nr:hypothetical protein [Gemmata sp.]
MQTEPVRYKKADFMVQADGFARAFRADPKGFKAKYKDKVVELSGRLSKIRPLKGDVLLEGDIELPPDAPGRTVACMVEHMQDLQLGTLSIGQQVTFIGMADGESSALKDCRLDRAGASTAISTSIATVYAEFKSSPRDVALRYTHKSVILSVSVLSATTKDKKVAWKVTDANGDGSDQIEVFAAPYSDDRYLKGLGTIRPGDTIVLVAELEQAGDTLRLVNAVVAIPAAWALQERIWKK